jgi:formylmethanofuran dehydrogenase subunit D
MPYYLKLKKLDIKTGQSNIALLNVDEAVRYGIKAGDKIKISWQDKSVIAEANTSEKRVKPGLDSTVISGKKLRLNQILLLRSTFCNAPSQFKLLSVDC